MKPVEAMNAEELLLAFQSATRSEWTKGIIETANELHARLRAYDAAIKWSRDVVTEKWLGINQGAGKALCGAMSAARDAGKGAG
jgi:hypothetical protein